MRVRDIRRLQAKTTELRGLQGKVAKPQHLARYRRALEFHEVSEAFVICPTCQAPAHAECTQPSYPVTPYAAPKEALKP